MRVAMSRLFALLFGLMLAVGVAWHTLVSSWVKTDTDSVLKLRPHHPTALARQVQRAWSEGLTPEQAALAARFEGFANVAPPASGASETPTSEALAPLTEDLVRTVVRANPLHAQALATIGLLRATAGDLDGADLFMRAAALRSPRSTTASYWMMRQAFDNSDFVNAVLWGDGLLRLSPGHASFVMPLFWRMAENKSGVEYLMSELKANPPWLRSFFQSPKGNIADARTPLALYLKLKELDQAPARTDLTAYIALLLENKLYDLAHNTWLQTMSAEQLAVAGFIYDGSFKFDPAPFPFEWSLTRNAGVVVSRSIKTDGKGEAALRIDFSGQRTSPQLATQMLMLAPGSYTLSGYYDSFVRTRRGLTWSLHCVQDARTIAETEPFSTEHSKDGWTPFEHTFSVPTDNCRTQWLKLAMIARSDSETMVSGTLWIDRLLIKRQ